MSGMWYKPVRKRDKPQVHPCIEKAWSKWERGFDDPVPATLRCSVVGAGIEYQNEVLLPGFIVDKGLLDTLLKCKFVVYTKPQDENGEYIFVIEDSEGNKIKTKEKGKTGMSIGHFLTGWLGKGGRINGDRWDIRSTNFCSKSEQRPKTISPSLRDLLKVVA